MEMVRVVEVSCMMKRYTVRSDETSRRKWGGGRCDNWREEVQYFSQEINAKI
jgi:hypothetical protein